MIPRFPNVIALLDHAFERYRHQPAYTCAGQTLTYADIDRLSYRFACYLQNDLGLQPGDRLALQLPNILQYPVALYGALRAGLVVVNANPLYTPREIQHQLKDSGAKVLVLLSNIASNAASVIENTDVEHVIVTDFADLHPAPKRWMINFAVRYIKKMVPRFHFPKQIDFRKALSCEGELTPVARGCDDILALQYTGGTTGVSKGAMLSHGNLASNVWQAISHLPQAFEPGKHTFAACLPLYHIYALNLHALGAFCTGQHNILIPNPRDLKALVDAIGPHNVSVFVGINTLFNSLCRYEPFTKLDFSSLKVTSSGGMALTKDAAMLWYKTTNCKISEGYGLTETSPVVCGNPLESIQLGTIGVPLIETELKLIDDAGNLCPQGSVGELCVRGPQVMLGYWNHPQETAMVLDADGWLKTGDMAVVQADNYVRIVDRKKDMILVSGFNVYPNEVEDVVCRHPDIVEAAVIGVPEKESGEAVKLFVVKSRPTLSEQDILTYCREHLAGYKVPKFIEFRESLPKSNVGKILRKDLRE